MHAFTKCLMLIFLMSSLVISIANAYGKLDLKLCCDQWKSYSLKRYECEEISTENRNINWTKGMDLGGGLISTVNIQNDFEHKVQSPCKEPELIRTKDDLIIMEHIFGDFCFTPQSINGTQQYTFLPLPTKCDVIEKSNVQEESVDRVRFAHVAKYFTGAILFLILLLPTICVYTSIKELREKIQTKLFICYGIVTIIPFVLMMATIYDYYYPFLNNRQRSIIYKTSFYFGISGINWSGVICFEMRRTFSQTCLDASPKKDFKRFIWYSLYVWSLSFVVALLASAFAIKHMDDVFLLVFFVIHTIIFLKLSFDICVTRLNAAKLKEGKQSVWKNVRIIVRLSAMMGISQLTHYAVYMACELNGASLMTAVHVTNIICCLDALVILVLFVMRTNVRNMIKTRYNSCCGSKSSSKSKGPTTAV
uniref:G-protein coupled receptors family 2 profile 2 domain-containing protein n=1 Tax=Stomoxys calcitrans TaxID=35570 RepID=A0A1I8PD27_STOCA